MTMGERIKKRRLELQLSQTELASRMGYKSRAAICKVETGEDNITADRITKFATALNTTESYLMGWDEEDAVAKYAALEGVDTDKLAKLLTGMESSQYLDKLMSLSDVNREMIFSMIDRLYALEHGSDKPQ